MRGNEARRMPCGRSLPTLLCLLLLGAREAYTEAEQEVPPCPARCACYVPGEVHCTFRSLTSFPGGIWRGVERVNFGYNHMTSLPVSALAGLTRLRLLFLHGNEITEIPDGAMRDLGALQVLKLSHNSLRTLTSRSLQGARALTRLHLDHNRLTSLDADALLGLTSLRLLTLEGNALTSLAPGGLATFDLLGGRGFRARSPFRVSTLRHLSLADNALTSLPTTLLPAAPLLETLALHGNPWACDCARAAWVGAWTVGVRAALRCRRDRGAEGGTSCPTCSDPAHFRTRDLRDLRADEVRCTAPALRSPPRNGTRGSEPELAADKDDLIALSGPDVDLDLADARGNRVTLACNPRGAGPPRMTDVRAVQAEGAGTLVEASVTLDLVCAATRDAYERVWRLLAYYSDVSAAMAADPETEIGDGDDITARYAQDPDDDDTLYYTGLRVNLTTPPEWAWLRATRLIRLRLDRKRTSSERVLLTYEARLSRALRGPDGDGHVLGDAGDDVTPWVSIAPDPDAGGVIAAEGEEVRLPCDVTASAPPAVAWRLPGGALITRTLVASEDDVGERETPARGDDVAGHAPLSALVLEKKPTTRGDDVDEAPPGAWHHSSVRMLWSPGDVLKSEWSLGSRLYDISQAAPDAWQSRKLRSLRSDVAILRDGSLLLRAAGPDDAGRYVCVASVGAGAIQDRATRRLLVTSRSGSSRGDDAVTLREPPGAAVTLPCAVSGAAAVAWELPGGRLLHRGENASSGAAVDGSGSITLAPMRGGESGRFRCLAVNQAGRDEFAVELVVTETSGSNGDAVESDVTGGGAAKEGAEPEPRKRPAENPEVTTPGDFPSPWPPNPRPWEREGRRGRRVHMTPPRVSPARWTDILARVRGRKHPDASRDVADATLTPSPAVVAGETDSEMPGVTDAPDVTAAAESPGGVDVNGSFDVVNGANIHIAPVSAPSAEGEESVEAAPPLQFHPDSSAGHARSSEKRSRGGEQKGFVRRKLPWGFPVTASNPTSGSQTSATTSYDLTAAPRDRLGRKRLRHRGRPPQPPTSVSAGLVELQLPVLEAPPKEVASTQQTSGRKGVRRRVTSTPVGASGLQEVVTHGGGPSASPVHQAGLLTSPPVMTPTQGEVTAAVADITTLSSNDVVSTTIATYVIRGTESDATLRAASNDVTAFMDDVTTAPGLALSPETVAYEVINGLVTPDTVADLSPFTVLPEEEATGNSTASTSDDVIGDVVGNSTYDIITVMGLGDLIAHTPNDVIDGDISSSTEVPPPALETATSQPQPDIVATATVTPPTISASTTPIFPMTSSRPLPVGQEVVLSPSPEVETESRPDPRHRFSHGPPRVQRPALDKFSAPPEPPSFRFTLPRVGFTVRSTPPVSPAPSIPPFRPQIHAHLGPPAPPASHSLYVSSRDPVSGSSPQRPRVVSRSPSPVSVAVGADAVLDCEAMGNPTPWVTWTKVTTGAMVTSSSRPRRFELLHNGSLVIRAARVEDSGDYACAATNVHGVDRALVALRVAAVEKPHFEVPMVMPRDMDASEGDTVAMECQARGTPAPLVTWLLPEDVALAPGSSARGGRVTMQGQRLTVRDVVAGDGGIYTCMAGTAAGVHRVALRLRVFPRGSRAGDVRGTDRRHAARIVASSPPRVHVSRGSRLRLLCEAVGAPTPRVLWRLPSRRLLDALSSPDPRISVAADGSLSVSSVIEGDAGDYMCLARNLVGDDSATFTVHVLAGAEAAASGFPSWNSHTDLSVVDVHYGNTAWLPCVVALALRWTEIAWTSPARRPVAATPSSGKYRVDAAGTLEIHAARRADAGNYTCAVRTAAGDVFHSMALLRVAVLAPRIRSAVTDVVVAPGGRTQIPCQAEGFPPPRVLWALPGGVVLPSPFLTWPRLMVLADGTLEIHDARESDAGRLECIARNEGGEARVAVQLTVTPDPRYAAPTAARESVTAAAGHTITLRCPGSTWLPPGSRLLWLLPDGAELAGGRGRGRFHNGADGALHVAALMWSDAGDYRCVTADAPRVDVGILALSVEPGPPDAQADDAGSPVRVSGADATPVVTTRLGSSVRVACRGVGIPGSPVTWELPDRTRVTSSSVISRSSRVRVDSRGWLALWPVAPGDAGLYRCWAQGGDVARAVFVRVD